MIKNLIKVAGDLDRLGLTKEADQIDRIIRKVGGNMSDFTGNMFDNGKTVYHGNFIADEEMALKIHPSYKGGGRAKFNWKFSPEGGGMVDLYASHPYDEVAPQFLASMPEEDLSDYVKFYSRR